MRYDKRYERVLAMITDEAVPRFDGGGIALCKLCQRATQIAGGFLQLLAEDIEKLAIKIMADRRK